MQTTALKTQVTRVRDDMAAMRKHLDDMLGKMDSFVNLADRTAKEADDLAKSLSRPSYHIGRMGLPRIGLVPTLLIGLGAVAIYSPDTLSRAWDWTRGMVESLTMPTGRPTSGGMGPQPQQRPGPGNP